MKQKDNKTQAAPELEDAAVTILQAMEARPKDAHAQGGLMLLLLNGLSGIKNSEAKQALAVGAVSYPHPEKLIYRQLHDEVLNGIDLQPGDVIMIEPGLPLDQGELVVGIITKRQRYVAGYFYQLESGAYCILGASSRAYLWQGRPAEIEILGRIVGFDAFYGIEDLEGSAA